MTFDPGERHTVRGLTDARLLLLLSPWPGVNHYTEGEQGHAQQLPANATTEPIPSIDTAAERPG